MNDMNFVAKMMENVWKKGEDPYKEGTTKNEGVKHLWKMMKTFQFK